MQVTIEVIEPNECCGIDIVQVEIAMGEVKNLPDRGNTLVLQSLAPLTQCDESDQ